MYKPRQMDKATTKSESTIREGETIEAKMRRVMSNKEPIGDGGQPIYTDRKDGVLAGTNIRTDRFDVAIDAMEKVSQTKQERRAKVLEMRAEERKKGSGEGEGGNGNEGGGEAGKAGGEGNKK